MMGDLVVLGLDDSPFSEEAFDWYFNHMHRDGNKLCFVHCLEMPAMPTRDTFDKQNKAAKEKGKVITDRYCEKLQQLGITSPEFVLDFMKPGEMLVEVARKKDADVIVMGTRGMGKLARTFLGSVSNYVLNHAHCPVLVVRPTKEEA